jgi:hypothetical protein
METNTSDQKRIMITSFLGVYLDGWADLIEGMGAKKDDVIKGVLHQLDERQMPDVKVEEVTAKASIFINDYRDYKITTTYPGATTTIFISQHGKDLFTSWRTFINPPFNVKLFAFFFLFSVTAAFTLAGSYSFFRSGMKFYNYLTNLFWERINLVIFQWLIYAAGVFIFGMIILTVLSHYKKKDIKTYYTPSRLAIALLGSLYLGWTLNQTSDNLHGVIIGISRLTIEASNHYTTMMLTAYSWAIGMTIALEFAAMFFGLIFQRNYLFYITHQPTQFDAEDIVAMELSVHKSLLRALDSAGIDTEKLRLKRDFNAGRRGNTL